MRTYKIKDESTGEYVFLIDNSNIIKFCREFKFDITKLKFSHKYFKQHKKFRDLYYKDVFLGCEAINDWIFDFYYDTFKYCAIFIYFKTYRGHTGQNPSVIIEVVCELKKS